MRIKLAIVLALTVISGAAAPAGEFIFEQAPFASCHASTLVETGPGELLAAWFGGSAEGRPDVAIWGARKSAGRWSQPVELAREPGIAAYNPVLFYALDKTLCDGAKLTSQIGCNGIVPSRQELAVSEAE
jgi:predicted neuraminidase